MPPELQAEPQPELSPALRQELISNLTANLAGENPVRPKQRNVQQDMIDDLADPGNPAYGLIKRPTGTGKTANMLNAAIAMDQRTLIIVPRKYLADQTAFGDGFLKKDYNFKIDPNDIGVYHSDRTAEQNREAPEKKFLITTYSSALNLQKQGLISSDPSNKKYYRPVVMLDEVHRSRGPAVKAFIKPFLKTAYVTGWTATDKFASGTDVSEEIFNGRKRIHETSILKAVADKEICSYTNLLVNTRVAFGSKINIAPGESPKEEDVSKIVNTAGRDEQAIQMYANYYDEDTGIGFRGKTAVCYCGGIEHARRLARKFNEALKGVFPDDVVPAISISGKTPKKDYWVEAHEEDGQMVEAHMEKGRDTILKEYKAGKIKVLCNADLLVEGFDAPNASICFMMVPTGSPIVCEQAGGRVLRKDKNDKDKYSFIVNLVDEGITGGLCFGQIAGAMQSTPEEMVRQKQLRGERERPEERIKLPDGMVQIEHLEIVSSIEKLEQMRLKRDEENKLPLKGLGWLNMPELRDALGRRNEHKLFEIGDSAMASMRQKAEAAAPRDGMPVEFPLADGVNLKVAWLVNTTGHQTLCYSPTPEALDYMQASFGRKKPDYTPWKSSVTLQKELADKLSLSEYPAPYAAFWESVESALNPEGKGGLKYTGSEVGLQVGAMHLRAMVAKSEDGRAPVATISVDDPTRQKLANYFLAMGVPPRSSSRSARKSGYFNAEQLVKLGLCTYRGSAEMLFKDMAAGLNPSLPVAVPATVSLEGTPLQGAFISSRRNDNTIRAYIPSDSPEVREAWRSTLAAYEQKYRQSIEKMDVSQKLASLNEGNELPDRGGYLVGSVRGFLPENLRLPFGQMYKDWNSLVVNAPYEAEVTLPNGEPVIVFLRKSMGSSKPQLCMAMPAIKETESGVDAYVKRLTPAIEKQMEIDGADKPPVAPPILPPAGDWYGKFEIYDGVKRTLGEDFDSGEFNKMMERLSTVAAGKSCELHLPGEPEKPGMAIKVGTNKKNTPGFGIFAPSGQEEAIITALASYAKWFDKDTPSPTLGTVEPDAPPAPPASKTGRKRG